MWTDGVHVTYGGDGRGGGPGGTTIPCNFMFPGTTDPLFPINWTMSSAGILPNDMRFLESAGKFTMGPGAVNYISTGVVWARATSGGPSASVALLKIADSTIQQLFDNCFTIGIDQMDEASAFSLYPNPCVSTSILKFNNSEGKNMTLKIFDTEGRRVQWITNIVSSEVSIDSKQFKKGIYIYQLSDNKKIKASGKLTVL